MIDKPTALSTPELAQIARSLFADASFATRTIQSLRPRICPFDQLIPLVPRGSTILDFGCGNGLFLGLLAQTGYIVEGVGVDIDDETIAIARSLNRNVSDRISLRFENWKPGADLPPGSFDVISIIDVMHHIPPEQQERTVIDLLNRLKPAGLFLYKDIASKPLWRALANRAHDLLMAKQWIYYFPTSEVRRIAVEHGMIVRRDAYIPRLWYGHDLLLIEKPT